MKARIQRSIGLVLLCTLLVFCVLFIGVIYMQTERLMHESVQKETEFIAEAINASDYDYIETIVEYADDSRITLIDAQGNVLFDTDEDPEVMENHGEREEVVLAFAEGVGETTRYSDTIGEQTYYYAVLLEDGSVIRIARRMETVLGTCIEVVPYIFGLGLMLWVLSMFVARFQTKKLIEPINKLDVENPQANEIYPELLPLINRIDTSNKAKAEIETMRREFSANVSHELKTPLTSISGYAELMQNGLVRAEDMERFSGKIYTEANRLIVLVEDIIKISKLDEGSVELEKEEVDLYFLVREICSRLSLQASKKNVHVEIAGQGVKFFGVKQVLDEMIYNICENAIKYNKDNGHIDIWVGSTLTGPKIIIKDTGIGIPADQQERVFERFYRVDKSHSKDTGGTGLGLSIVKHGAILHKVEINLTSEVDVGTRIELLF